MRMNLNIEFDGSDRDVRILNAISKAINNVPPEGFVSVDSGTLPDVPMEITVHCPPDKVEEATEAVVKAPAAKIKTEEVETPPEPTPPPAAIGVDVEYVKSRGQRLRELLLAVSKMDGKSIADAKAIAATAAGLDPSDINKDFPAHPMAEAAIVALEAAI